MNSDLKRKKKVVFCGCSDDWAIVDPDHVPTAEDNGVYAHGFENEREAFAFIGLLEADIPGLSYWVPISTDEDPFEQIGEHHSKH
jgi:hypothetical protein